MGDGSGTNTSTKIVSFLGLQWFSKSHGLLTIDIGVSKSHGWLTIDIGEGSKAIMDSFGGVFSLHTFLLEHLMVKVRMLLSELWFIFHFSTYFRNIMSQQMNSPRLLLVVWRVDFF